jgi:cellulose synthase (UDP-forming)
MSPVARTKRGRHHRGGCPVLPAPPDDREKASYAWRPRPLPAIALGIGALPIVIAQFWLEISHPVLAGFVCCTIIYLAYQAITIPMTLACRGFDAGAHSERVRKWQPARHPDVDICLPICGEHVAVLRNTWAGVSELVDAYPGCARPLVLDDGPSDEAREVSASHGFRYLRRPESRQFGKHGNLNYGFGRTESPLLVVLDADCRPRPDFLAHTLPYFDDPAVGIVQTPRFDRPAPRPTWVEQASVPIAENFGRVAQVRADRFSAAVCVGSNVVYRRAALAAAGGFALATGGEDALGALDMRRKGYRLKYLPLPLAAGAGPARLQAFVRQQYRSCRGAMSVAFSRQLWQLPMPGLARLPYLSGWLGNLVTGLCALALPLLPVVVLAWLPGDLRPAYAMLLVPLLLARLVLWPLWRGTRVHPRSWPMSLARGWVQALVTWDFLRGQLRSRPLADAGRRIRRGITVWNGGLGLAWIALAVWRFAQAGSWPLAVAIALGLVYLTLVGRVVLPGNGAA